MLDTCQNTLVQNHKMYTASVSSKANYLFSVKMTGHCSSIGYNMCTVWWGMLVMREAVHVCVGGRAWDRENPHIFLSMLLQT